MSKALVVLSGGQDSTTCLFMAKQQYDEVHAVSFNYGQRHIMELRAARQVAAIADVASHEVVELGANILASTSPLVSRTPLEKYDSFEQMDQVIGDRVEVTFVPLRNLLFLTVAANRAVALGCSAVVVGVCQADNANYPDCRGEFVWAAESAIKTALGDNGIEVQAPLLHNSKAATVRAMHALGRQAYAALAFTHTSYDGQYPPTDGNHANVLRAEGFKRAGRPDPLVLRAWKDGLMELPDTPNYHCKSTNWDVLGDVMALGRALQVVA